MSITTEEARLKMEAVRYTGGNKGLTFQKYLTTHLQAHVLMEQNPALSTTYSEFHKKDLLLKGIKRPNLKTVVEIARAKPEQTFAQTINYLRSSVTNHELNRTRDGEERQVRFTQSGRGSGGGRGGGRKRGKRGGRGRGKEKDKEDDTPRAKVVSAAAVTSRPKPA